MLVDPKVNEYCTNMVPTMLMPTISHKDHIGSVQLGNQKCRAVLRPKICGGDKVLDDT